MYSQYKSVDLNFAEQIPADWKTLRGKFVFKEISERSKNGKEQLLSVSEHKGVVPRDSINVTMFQAENYEGYKLCKKGDVVINSLWAWHRGLGVSEYEGIVSTAYSVLRLQKPEQWNYKFLNYLLRTNAYTGEYLIRSKGIWTSRLQLTSSNFLDIPILIPPLEVQNAIIAYLDKKNEEIDLFIQKKENLIDLFKEERIAIIDKLVSKGLTQNTKFKPTNVYSFEKIPEHWQIKKLKYICSLLRDGTHLPPPRVQEGFPLLSVRNLVDGKFVRFLDDDSKVSKNDFRQLEKTFEVKENDILLAIVGATLGKVSLVPKMEKFSIQRSVAIFRTKEKFISYKFLFYFFQSSFFQNTLWNNVGFSAQPGIYLGALGDFSTTCPPLEEQEKIIEVIETETEKIDIAISKVKKEIELIENYRESLITNVITGQKAVPM